MMLTRRARRCAAWRMPATGSLTLRRPTGCSGRSRRGCSRCSSRWTSSPLQPSFHDLLQFGRGAELSAQRFRKGDNLLAQGYVRNHLQTADGRERTEQQFVAKRLAHDPNITTYHVERRGRGSERDAPGLSQDLAVREITPSAATQAAVGAGPNGLQY